jgi:hypothetical protein
MTALNRSVRRLKLVVVAPAKALSAAFARVPDELMQAVRVADGERPQHVDVEHGERNRQQPETDGQRAHRRDHERRTVRIPRHA